jgi:hypothetical protein
MELPGRLGAPKSPVLAEATVLEHPLQRRVPRDADPLVGWSRILSSEGATPAVFVISSPPSFQELQEKNPPPLAAFAIPMFAL